MIKRNKHTVRLGLIVFGVSALLSFFVFRQGKLRLTVKLAKVEFREELPRAVDTNSPLNPFQKWNIDPKLGGKLSRYLVQDGDVVKREQIVATIDEEQNKATLESALANFKIEKGKAANSKERLSSGALTQKEYDEIQSQFFSSKTALENAKQKMEDSLIRAPSEGRMRYKTAKVGDPIKSGDTLAEIEDWSKSILLITVPDADSHEIPNHVRVFISSPGKPPSEEKPIEAVADVHAADAKATAKPNEVNLELILQGEEALAKWRHQVVHLNIPLKSLKHVALVDQRAVLKQNGDARIPVLNSYGFLHWQKVDSAPIFENHIVIKGVDAKSFRAVIPENPELINQAITLNAKPKVKDGG